MLHTCMSGESLHQCSADVKYHSYQNLFISGLVLNVSYQKITVLDCIGKIQYQVLE